MRTPALPGLDNTTPALGHAWHVVATSDEVTDRPVEVWLLGVPWCLARVAGRVTASAGRGHRRSAPWAVDERHGLVWLAPEEPLADRHAFGEWGTPGFDHGLCEVVRTPAGAALLVDNFLDAAHFPFVHAATFGVDESAEVSESGIVRNGWMVTTTFSTWYREGGVVQPQDLRKTGTASLSIHLRLDFPETDVTIGILFCCTPERAGQTRVYKVVARNDLAGDHDRLTAFLAEEDQILVEDLRILERYDHEDLPLDRTVEVHTRADRLSLAWRSVMADFVRAVDGATEAAAPTRAEGPPSEITASGS